MATPKMGAFKRSTASTWRALKDIFEDEVRPPQPEELDVPDSKGSPLLHGGNQSVYVKIVSARGLLAMDNNNLSDPYAVVSLGDYKHVTRVCRKTLAPVFDETFVFGAEMIRSVVAKGEAARISVAMMDWDQFSADDFMGLGTVSLQEVFRAGAGTPVAMSLPLVGYKGRGRKRTRVDCGSVQVSVWWVDATEEKPVVDFSRQVGLRGAPRMLHGGDNVGVIIEEPYFIVLCLNLLDVHIASDDDPLSKSSRMVKSQSAVQRSTSLSQYRAELRRKQAADALGMGDDEEVYDDLDLGINSSTRNGILDGSDAQNAASDVGSFAYFRVTLGSKTTKTSHLVRQQGDTVPINDQIPFLLPVPVPDGQLQLVLYRTHASKAAGVATHVCLVDVYSLLPDADVLQQAGLDLTTTLKDVKLSLTPIKKNQKQKQATLKLKVTLADLDFRRRFASAGIRQSMTQRVGWADPRLAVSVVNQDLTVRLSEEDMLELESRTDADYQNYRIQKAAFDAQKQRVEGFVRGAVERQIEKVEKVIGKDIVHGKQVLSEAEGTMPDTTVDGDEPDGEEEQQTVGRLTVSLQALTTTTTLPHAAVIFNVEQTWFRTGDVNVSAAETQIEGFTMVFPVVSPGAMFSACLVSKGRKKDSKEVTRGSFVDQGVLRFRLSSLECGKTSTFTLPFMSSREKGGRVVGHARLSICLEFPSLKAQIRGFGRPEFPQECYVHMINRSPTMESLQKERRELLTDWMLSMNPPFPTEALNMISRVDCEEFSLSRLRANLRRIRIALKGLKRLKKHFDLLASWQRPNASRAGLVGAVFTAYYPSIALSALAMYLTYALWKDMPSSSLPDAMEEDVVGMDMLDRTEKEELREGVQLQVVRAGVVSNLRHRWSSIISIIFMVQDRMDAVASVLERFESLLDWKAPMVSALLVFAVFAVGCVIFLIGLRPISAGLLMFLIRPPRMRKPWPPGPIASFLKIPVRGDRWS